MEFVVQENKSKNKEHIIFMWVDSVFISTEAKLLFL